MEHHDAKANDAKARFVNYCKSWQRILQEDELKERFKAGQKEKIEAVVQETLQMLYSHEASVCLSEEDFSTMQEKLEAALAKFMPEGCEAADAGGVREAAMPEAQSHEAVDSGGVSEATMPEAPSHEAVSSGGLPGVPEAEMLYYSEGGV